MDSEDSEDSKDSKDNEDNKSSSNNDDTGKKGSRDNFKISSGDRYAFHLVIVFLDMTDRLHSSNKDREQSNEDLMEQ